MFINTNQKQMNKLPLGKDKGFTAFLTACVMIAIVTVIGVVAISLLHYFNLI